MKKIKENREAEKALKKQEKERIETNKEYLKNIDLTTLDAIPFKDVADGGKVGFEYINDMGFFNLFQIVSFDYIAATDAELMEHIYMWDAFFRTNSNDTKWIGISLPLDLSSNYSYFKYKAEKSMNPMYKLTLQETLDEIDYASRYKESKEFYLFAYGKTYDDLVKLNARIMGGLGSYGLVQQISQEKKIEVMRKYSNPYNKF